jgi:hypothetical protein
LVFRTYPKPLENKAKALIREALSGSRVSRRQLTEIRKLATWARNAMSENHSDEFLSFWKQYPRRVGKRNASKAFKEAKKRAPVADILRGAFVLAERVKAGKLEIRYCPYPATYLRRDGWEDEYDDKPAYQRPTGPRRTWAEIQAELKKDVVG